MSSPEPGVVIIWTDSVRPGAADIGERARRPRLRSWSGLAKRALLLGVPLAYLAALLIGPLVAVLQGAFADGVGAFVTAVTSADAVHALLMTLALSAVAIVLNTVFGVAIAWTICRDRFPGRALLGGLVDLPFAVSPVVVGLMTMLLFGNHGWFGPWLKSAGFTVLFSWPAMALVTTFVSLPCVVREVTPVLEEIGISEEEAARTLGASRVQTFLRVVLPNIRWGIAYGVALTAARTLGEFGGVLLVSGGLAGKTETATLLIYRELEERHDTTAHAMAVVLACASILILVVMEFLKHRRDRDLRQAGSK
ncbi:MAG TPA: sulfate ABC transporter permease subunit [Polyangiaceae bacterium]|nr:sulfate ABC transporter permease subunit [Polyangiaceae bacterium]